MEALQATERFQRERRITESELLRLEDRYFVDRSIYDQTELSLHRSYHSFEQRVAIVRCGLEGFWKNNWRNNLFPEGFTQSQKDFIKRYAFGSNDPVANPIAKRRDAAAVTKLWNYSIRMELESILRGESEDYPEFTNINITREAYNKANFIAKRMLSASRNPDEIYLHALRNRTPEDDKSESYLNRTSKSKLSDMLARSSSNLDSSQSEAPLFNFQLPINRNVGVNFGIKDGSKDITITDFYIPPQRVTPVSCTIDSSRYGGHRDKIKSEGKHVVGWTHSHANFNTFHSGTDEENLKYTEGTQRVITVDFHGRPLRILVDVVPSLVFNALDSRPDVRIASRYTLPGSEALGIAPKTYYVGINRPNKGLKLNITNETNNISLDSEIIDRQIYERVNTTFKPDFVRRMQTPAPVNIAQAESANPSVPGPNIAVTEPSKDSPAIPEISKKEDKGNLESKIEDVLSPVEKPTERDIYPLTTREYSEILQRLQRYEIQNTEYQKRINHLENLLNKRLGWIEAVKKRLLGLKDISGQ